MGTSSLRPIPPPEDSRGPQQGLESPPENAPDLPDVLAEMQRLSKLTPDEVDPQKAELVRALWRSCITNQKVQDSGPAKELLAAGVPEEAVLKVIHKAALESLISALITFDHFEITEEFAPWVFLGDPNRSDGAPFNY